MIGRVKVPRTVSYVGTLSPGTRIPWTDEESRLEVISRLENLKKGLFGSCRGEAGGVAGGEIGDCGLLWVGDGGSGDNVGLAGVVGGLAGNGRILASSLKDLAFCLVVGCARSG